MRRKSGWRLIMSMVGGLPVLNMADNKAECGLAPWRYARHVYKEVKIETVVVRKKEKR
jgi:hypothetical protein